MAKKSIRKIRRQRTRKRAAVAQQRSQNKAANQASKPQMSKEKRRAFISKISSDGKIGKKEGKKAAKKGISLAKIVNRNIGDYRAADRAFDNRPHREKVRNPAAERPTYQPLKIKRGAYMAQAPKPQTKDRSAGRDRRAKLAKIDKKRNKKNKNLGETITPTPTPTPTTDILQPKPPVTANANTENYDFVNDIGDRLDSLSDDLNQQMMREDPRYRQYVLGIRTRRGKRNRQGSRGTFGRRGRRLANMTNTSMNLS